MGSIVFIQLSSHIETLSDTNIIKKSLVYMGKYSLQFYLFTFPYPIIRVLLVSKLGLSDPILIIVSVFILQLLTITPIVEITRRIKWLKIPCGY